MSIKIFLPIFFTVLLSISHAQWHPQSCGVDLSLYDVQFVNDSTGFVVGENGIILKTGNGGKTWFQLNSNVTSNLSGISMISNNTGWVATGSGVVLRTQDGGNTWTSQATGITDPLTDIQFLDANHGWVSTIYDKILLTTDSGISWTSYSTGINNTLLTLFFTDLNTGWVGGWGGILMKTSDGGKTWNPQNSGADGTRRSLFFLNENFGWSAGPPGVVTKTTDGGVSWKKFDVGFPVDIASVFFVSADTGWIAGRPKILGTSDGGATWELQLDTPDKNFQSLWFQNSSVGWVIGSDGVMYKYDPSPYVHILIPAGGEKYKVGQQINVNWESFAVQSIKLEYSIDNGSNWLTIVDNLPSETSRYNWEIPNTPSSECLIKISDANNPNIFDIIDNTISFLRSPRLLSPNGGQYLYANQLLDIQWDAGGVETFMIEISRNNGDNWEIIADNVDASSEKFGWNVTPPQSNECLIRITDQDYRDFFDVSDAEFQIDADNEPHHYFPLAPGNQWLFEGDDFDYTLFIAEKDTLLDGGYNYTIISEYYKDWTMDDFYFLGSEYYRQAGDSVICYPNSVILNFNWQEGDTLTYKGDNSVYMGAVYEQEVFGRRLTTYLIMSGFRGFEKHSYTDGIGFNLLYYQNFMPELTRSLKGCIIDGVEWGNIVSPVQIYDKQLPGTFYLDQNYPNPFNSTTTISFSLPKRERVILKIFDITGKKIDTIVNEVLGPGKHSVTFNAEDLASGIYYYKLNAGQFSECKKLIYVK